MSPKSQVLSPKKKLLATCNLQLGTRKGSALITGGAKRIGKSIALYLAEYGYDIGLHYNTSHKDAENTAEEIRKLGANCELFKADLGNLKELQNLAREASGILKNYNLLINSASVFEKIAFLETTPEDYARNMDVNFRSAFFLSQSFAKNFKGKNGNVINLTDTFITKSKSSYFPYMLSKKLLADFSSMAASELGPKIRVNALALGIILPSKLKDEEYKIKKEKELPMKKAASLEDVNKAVNYILESNITGECIFLDGGHKLI